MLRLRPCWMANRMPDVSNTPSQSASSPLFPIDLDAYADFRPSSMLCFPRNIYRCCIETLDWRRNMMIPRDDYKTAKKSKSSAIDARKRMRATKVHDSIPDPMYLSVNATYLAVKFPIEPVVAQDTRLRCCSCELMLPPKGGECSPSGGDDVFFFHGWNPLPIAASANGGGDLFDNLLHCAASIASGVLLTFECSCDFKEKRKKKIEILTETSENRPKMCLFLFTFSTERIQWHRDGCRRIKFTNAIVPQFLFKWVLCVTSRF